MDITLLAQSLSVYLAPFLPYLLKAGEKAAEEAGKKLGGDGWDQAKSLWAKLRPEVEAKPGALDAVRDAAKIPTDDDAIHSLGLQIEKLLDEDRQLAKDLSHLVTSGGIPSQVNASGQGAVAIGRDVNGGPIITGTGNLVGRTSITGDGNVIGDGNSVNVTKTNIIQPGITLDQFIELLTQLRGKVQSANLDDRTKGMVNSDFEYIEEEAKCDRPNLPLIETKLKAIEAVIKGTRNVGIAVTTLVPLIQKAVDYAHRLFS